MFTPGGPLGGDAGRALGALASVTLLTAGPIAEAEAFYSSFGLERIDPLELEGRVASTAGVDELLFRATGPNHHVLRLVAADHTGLGSIHFTAESRAAVRALHEHYLAVGVDLIGEPGALDGPAGGYGFAFRDLEGRHIEVATERRAADPRSAAQPLPTRITHVVLNTSDIDAACAFWVERLGFAVSDWSEHQMVFLRNGTDHHTIAFNQEAHASVNHVAYEVPNLESFLRSVGRMKRAGIEPLWGIGRHGPGNNSFAYYGDPVGFVPEFTSDVQQIDSATWVPRVWQRVPQQSDLWGLAGAPSAELRAIMKGQPDPGPGAHHPTGSTTGAGATASVPVPPR